MWIFDFMDREPIITNVIGQYFDWAILYLVILSLSQKKFEKLHLYLLYEQF